MRYVHLPAGAVDVPLLEDATRRGKLGLSSFFFSVVALSRSLSQPCLSSFPSVTLSISVSQVADPGLRSLCAFVWKAGLGRGSRVGRGRECRRNRSMDIAGEIANAAIFAPTEAANQAGKTK